MPVLVDVPVITVTLVGSLAPQVAQIAVTGLTVGQSLSVTGNAGGVTWTVRGGDLIATGTQVVLRDVLAPLNAPVTYTVVADGTISVTSAPITVPYDGRYVMQSLDGRMVVPFVWQDNGVPRDHRLRSEAFDIPGRASPVVRYDVAAGEQGAVRLRLSRAASDTLRRHLREGGPIVVVRTDAAVRDIAPAEFWLLVSASSVLWGALTPTGPGSDRVWELRYDVIDDPEPSVVVAVSTVTDFNAVYAALTVADFNAEWSGGTVAEFNLVDWTTR